MPEQERQGRPLSTWGCGDKIGRADRPCGRFPGIGPPTRTPRSPDLPAPALNMGLR